MIDPSELSQKQIDMMDPQDRASLNLLSSKERHEKEEHKTEADIQRAVEAYLVHLGYEKRTPDDINRGKPRSGWQVHIHKAKKNPILLDIVVMQHTDTPGTYRCVEIELKTKEGTVSPEQTSLVHYGAPLFRSAETACEFLKEWHEQRQRPRDRP